MKKTLALVGMAVSAMAGGVELRVLDLQRAIDAAPLHGTVLVPAGDWEVKPFRLKSDMALCIEKGAHVYATTNLADYASGEGERTFISAVDATNLTVCGKGVFFGRGDAFKERAGMTGEAQPQALPVMMRFTRCRNLRLEDFTYRDGGAWGCHLRNCDGVRMRRVTCFNHINKTNDGIDIESCNVVIDDCDIDADDDAIVLKSESDRSFAVTNVIIRNSRLASSCNAFKFGTGSYGDFRSVRVENCLFDRPKGNYRFDWKTQFADRGVREDLTGLGGIAIEVVDGGRLEDVVVRNIDMKGYMMPIFIRLARRHGATDPRGSYLRNVLIENVKAACATSRNGCSITGVPGLRPSDITLRNVRLTFPGGGTTAERKTDVPELESAYPEGVMFGRNLPAWAFYVRHADNIVFDTVACELADADMREKYVIDDADVRECHTPSLADVRTIKGEKVIVNYDPTKVPPYKLEDPLVFFDGRRVVSPAEWPERRAEILSRFASEMYGVEPPSPDALETDLVSERVTCDGYAIRRHYSMTFRADGSGPCINWHVWLPRGARKPVPVILFLNYRGAHEYVADPDIPVMTAWTRNGTYAKDNRALESARGIMLDQNATGTIFPLQMILAHGYAVMTASYCEVSPDPDHEEPPPHDQVTFPYTGVFSLWGPRDESRTDNITSLGAWAWALSRGLDLAERIPAIDARRSVVTGCSRLGKSALLAAARDERFAVCVPNQCGGGGVCLAKRDYGESIRTELRMFRHWFCRAYDKYAEDPARTLTFDQHLLLASIAPRAVLVEGMTDSPWMDTEGEFLACKAAAPVWRFLGGETMPDVGYPENYSEQAIGRDLGYVRRPNAHGISGCDWRWMLDFADRQFKMEKKIVVPDRPLSEHGAWYAAAKLGVFVHWGLYSIPGQGEWARFRNGIAADDYARLSEAWNPDDGVEEKWVLEAKRMGARYMVFTTRHHDGFSLFDSKANAFNSMNTPAKRDHVRAFVEACRKHDMRIGFYYSLTDWRYENTDHAAMKRQVMAELEQLMTEYGKVDVLWYDGGWLPKDVSCDKAAFWDAVALNRRIRQWQPEILINDRAGTKEDFQTIEGRNIPRPPEGARLWESCLTLQDDDWSFWGYCNHTAFRKTSAQIVCQLLHCLEVGGNLLVNLGPDARGVIDTWQSDLMHSVGDWVGRHANAVYGTTATGIATKNAISKGWSGNACAFFTQKDDRYYLYFHAWPGRSTSFPVFGRHVRCVTLGDREVPFTQDDATGKLTLTDLPVNPPDPMCTVAEVFCR